MSLELDRAIALLRENALLPLLTNSADAVAILSGDRVVLGNDPLLRLLCVAGAAGAGSRPFVEWIHAEDRELLRAGASIRFNCESGREALVEVLQHEAITVEGIELRLIVLRDITELRRRHARLLLDDRMISVGTLAAGVAHEINNPLSYVIGNLAFLGEESEVICGEREDIAEALDEAREGAERVRQIVRDLQTFARADHQVSRSVDVRRTIELAINMAWIEIRHRARLVKDFAESLPPVEASEARLGQAFLSLLLNAAQALPEGNADKHQIRVATRTDDRDRVIVEVSDTGPGLTREVRQRIFDPFATSGAEGVGNGLGLSIAHTLVKDLGGEIEVESAPGRGALYRVALPKAAPRAIVAEPEAAHASPTGGARGRVLVVDDEPLIATSLKRTLKEHDVTVVSSGRMAIEVLSDDRSFDLVFCDLMMPELTGMDVHEWLRSARPGMEQRMVFMTGGTFTARASEFLQSVPNMRFEKPFDLDRVRVFVRDHLAVIKPSASGT